MKSWRNKVDAWAQTVVPSQIPSLLTGMFVFLLLLLFPLALWGGYAHVSASKFYLLTYLCCDYLLALLLALVFFRGFRSPFTVVQEFGWAERFLCLFFLVAWVSALLSPYSSQTLLGMGRYHGLLTLALYLFVALSVARLARWHRAYLYAAAVAVLLVASLAAWQLSGGNPFSLYPDGYTYYDGNQHYVGQFLSTLGNIDFLSAYLCLMLPLLLGGAMLVQGRGRWLLLAAGAAGLALLAAIQVSGGILAVLITFCVMLPFYLPVKRRTYAVVGILLLLLILLVLVFCFGGQYDGTVYEAYCLLHGEISDDFGSSRIMIWKDAFDDFSDWILGSGPGTRSSHFSTEFTRMTASGSELTVKVDSAHNEYIDYLLETGIIGLLCYLATLFFAARYAIRQAKAEPFRKVVAGAVLCYSIQAFFNLSVVSVAPLFWLMLGLLLSRAERGEATEAVFC